MPVELANKKAIINLKNHDAECLRWCITRALNEVGNHLERITEDLKEIAKALNWSGIEFPVAADANIVNSREIMVIISMYLAMKGRYFLYTYQSSRTTGHL